MTTNISLSGSGTVGDIVGGWQVVEDATPAVINDGSASVGSLSFSAAATDDTVYANDATATLTAHFSSTIFPGRDWSMAPCKSKRG